MQRTCVKCGHVNPQATGGTDEACPQCGAIYAKATISRSRPALRDPQSGYGGFNPSGHSTMRRDDEAGAALSADDLQHYVVVMRAQSLYPTVRVLAKVGHWFMVLLAVVAGVLGVVQWRSAGPFALFLGLGLAAFILVMSLAMRELSLMLADLSDASVRAAAVAETGER